MKANPVEEDVYKSLQSNPLSIGMETTPKKPYLITLRYLKKKASRFNNPPQVRKHHYSIVKFCGKVGFIVKGLIYGFIGYLCLVSVFSHSNVNESPQGVFIFISSSPNGFSHIALIALLCGLIFYAIWRVWEGISGQGYTPQFSRWKNFFRYRLSPLASALVYGLYAVYVITIFTSPKVAPTDTTRPTDATCFPNCWKQTVVGTIGIALLAIAFTIAVFTQLILSLTKNFHAEMKRDFFEKRDKWYPARKIIKFLFYGAGHVGFAARALLFALVAYFFWRVLLGTPPLLNESTSMVGQAVNIIQNSVYGLVTVSLLGIGLLIYGFFALLCVIFRVFPTPPPEETVLSSE